MVQNNLRAIDLFNAYNQVNQKNNKKRETENYLERIPLDIIWISQILFELKKIKNLKILHFKIEHAVHRKRGEITLLLDSYESAYFIRTPSGRNYFGQQKHCYKF